MRKRSPRPPALANFEVDQLLLELLRGALAIVPNGKRIEITFYRHSDMEWCFGALNNWAPI